MHTLPYAGGLLEQPPGTIFRMEAVLAASSQPDTAKSNRAIAEQKAEEKARGIRR